MTKYWLMYRLLLVPIVTLGIQIHLFAAQEVSPSAEMNNLINAGQFQQAFDLGDRQPR